MILFHGSRDRNFVERIVRGETGLYQVIFEHNKLSPFGHPQGCLTDAGSAARSFVQQRGEVIFFYFPNDMVRRLGKIYGYVGNEYAAGKKIQAVEVDSIPDEVLIRHSLSRQDVARSISDGSLSIYTSLGISARISARRK